MTKPVDKNKQLRARRDSKAPKVKKKISVNPKLYRIKNEKKVNLVKILLRKFLLQLLDGFFGFFGSFFLDLQF